MPRKNNFLLGHGERLVSKVDVPSGGGPKNPPYDFTIAKTRVATRLVATRAALQKLPAEACPNGEAVAVITMHPRYISKSDFPDELLSAVGLRSVGSRSRAIRPEKWGISQHPEEATTEDIFVAGLRTAFERWATQIPSWSEQMRGADELAHLEDVAPYLAPAKLRSIPEGQDEVLLEVVLHNAGKPRIIDAFAAYAQRCNARALMHRRRDVGGLTFIPVRVAAVRVEDLARFAFVRVARGMPSLRPFDPGVLRVASGFDVQLPKSGPVDRTFRAVIFDGGVPQKDAAALAPWVSVIEPPGIGPAIPAYQGHGLGVTTALLFGSLSKGAAVPQPFCAVDHVRILDDKTGADATDLEYVDALDCIVNFLDANPGKYQFANISLGPKLAVSDDEVTAWTAALDERFAHGQILTTVAVGNDGGLDAASGLNRVQPPADGVNVLSVGASDRSDSGWARADYSCVGPGRSPGLVKPDGIAFGGSDTEQFMVLGPGLRARGVTGTSFASPFALRSALSVRAQLGTALNPLTVRALLIHRAERGAHDQTHVGWGRFEPDSQMLITCDDDEALVVFRGDLPVREHLRAPVPVPEDPLMGMVTLSATLVIAPEVDPEHPGAYTRSGLEVSFRPHVDRFTTYSDGTVSMHPKTVPFFSASNLYGAPEFAFRDDGHKWEPCLRSTQRFQARSLKEPSFDIYYHHREAGAAPTEQRPIPYALIVSVKAPKVPDLYNQVVRTYAKVLVPLRPQVRIPINT